MPRLIIANLDCEQQYARDTAPRELPLPVRRMISAAGSLLAVLGRPGDFLWTPELMDASRVVVEPAHRMTFVSGDMAALAPDALLSWGETRDTARLRKSMAHVPAVDLALDWPELLWQLCPDPAIARRCNDRRYCFWLGQTWGLLLPGAAIVSSVDELARHLELAGHEHGQDGAWVLEAPFSASGRLRLRRRGGSLDRASHTRARRMFDMFGELIFQPWVERVFDMGCIGIIQGAERWTLFAPHWQDIDAAGVFRGLGVGDPAFWPRPPHPAPERFITEIIQTVSRTAENVARTLAADGYRGPFGIDAFVYRDRAGELHIHPMCEINARLSFGFVTHALARRYPSGQAIRLRLGTGPIPGGPGSMIPLLHPGPDDSTSAWLEL